jgi:hypothetical protein
MSKLEEKDFEIMLVLFFVFSVSIGISSLAAGKYFGEQIIKKQAIQNNAAEYVVDKDGNVTFKWKEQK